MNKIILYITSIFVLLGCRQVDPTPPTGAVGDPITQITVELQEPARSRVGVEVDPTERKDSYFWTEQDALVLCELDQTGTAFTGNNYQYGIKSVPTHGQSAVFEGVNAVTSGQYIVLHTRNWSNVSLPAAGGTIQVMVPWIEQRAALTANAQAAQAFADHLFFSTTRVTGTELLAGHVALLHQWVQVEVEVTGQAADNGKRIRRVELLPETAGGYAQSIAIDPTGGVTATGEGIPTTYVTDPSAQLGTPYKVRLLTRPTSLTTSNGASVRVDCGLESTTPSSVAPATAFEPGSIYTLAKQVGPADQPITIDAMTAKTFVGAFWKKDQIGERLIRINATDAADVGAWTASVVWTDGHWPEEDILIYTGVEPEWNNSSIFDSTVRDTPWVSSPTSVAKGVAVAKTETTAIRPIFFRLGLKNTYTPTPEAPARYAIVRLSYNNNTKNHLIYLRQGEDPAPIGQGSDVRWSVYNVGQYSNPTLYNNGGFTAFPSQAGFFKRWSATTMMYAPATPSQGSIATDVWKADAPFTELKEVCPAGYKTPSFLSETTGDMASLFVGTNLQEKRYILGYYADGFFDRGTIINGVGTNAAPTSRRWEENHYEGYQGALVVNTTTKASLFFPFAGFRLSNLYGALYYAGGEGNYWSSSKPYGPCHALFFNATVTRLSQKTPSYENDAMNIRCVKE